MTSSQSLARTLVLLAVSALLAVTLSSPAEAKRFGGGKSFGFQGQKSSQTTTQRQATTDQKATRSPGAGLGGMFAGLAAGGLLAWMFMGGAFEGLQPMDFLLILLLAVGAFLLIRHLRGGANGMARGRPAYAGGNDPAPTDDSLAQARTRNEAFDRSSTGTQGVRPGSLMDEFRFGGSGDYQPPAWFDETRFLGAARTHFTNLQLAWDANRMDEIREFVTPELFRELVRERAALGDAENVTEVVDLDVSLEDLGEEGRELVAAVRFTGQVREARDASAEALDETWLVTRHLDEEDANWLIAGIRQNT
ncbi:TIM44-like domain-containing protein [Guyparkeria hydrothermalis]|uniref:Tim44 domain-containing protein n=1 Tax=Guyparkeria TaxID=2035712 RepID=UPI0010AD682F|nr:MULTISPECIES: TIM44-like domain-containing protein [Guyparkeria]MCL7750106.1 TIM44-like domain-containing protein [Guyparkeria hydrothermalis]TKA89212.1 Tim44 domain-containing protein [Guyparkeria sp. SB14A]